jgi:hypothetical protein
MNRHVIKGRGENRGKYLCYARIAGLPTEAGYVWLPEQRKAARWGDLDRAGHTYATDVAAKHNGYFVKLVAPASTKAIVRELRTFIAEHAAGGEQELACYWFDGEFHDTGENFCRDCAEKLVDEKYAAAPKRFEELFGKHDDAKGRYRVAIDGGWHIEHDSPPRCATCDAKLSGNLTEYGADEEIEALTGDCAPKINDVESWAELDHAIVNLSDDDPRWRKIAKVVEATRAAEREKAEREAAIAAAPGMTEARSTFLTMLVSRQEQKRPDPSFRLWRTLLRWHALPYARRAEPTRLIAAVEKRLICEAKAFARALGYRAFWSGGMFMIEGPDGSYYWPFVVEREQFGLWNGPDYAAGMAAGRACLASDGAPGRDANPFTGDGVRAREWDAGFMRGLHEERRGGVGA